MQNRNTSSQILDVLRLTKTHAKVEEDELKASQELLMTMMASEDLDAPDANLDTIGEKYLAAQKAHAALHEVMNQVPEEAVVIVNNLMRTVAQQVNDPATKLYSNGVREGVAQAMPQHLSNMFAQQTKQVAAAARAEKAAQDLNASTDSDCSHSPKM